MLVDSGWRPKLTPCARCGAERAPGVGRGVRLCSNCPPLQDPKGCTRCGQPKPPGKGRRLCETCEPVHPRRAPRACGACSGELPQGRRGLRFCDECAELRREASQTRRNLRRTMKRRKPCRGGCGRPPGHLSNGKPSPYCSTCRADRETPRRRTCVHCDRKVEGPHDKVCAAHRRRVRSRRRADEPALLRKMPKMPAEPFGRRITEIVTRRAEADAVSPKVIYARAGLHPRAVFAWRTGEWKRVQFETADQALTALGLSWRDVWPDEQLRAAFGSTMLP